MIEIGFRAKWVSATSSFPWYQGWFDFSATQSPVYPALYNLSGITLSLADTAIRS